MKRFLRNIGLGVMVTFFVWFTTIAIIGTYAPIRFKSNLNYRKGATSGHTALRFREAADKEKVDILILGSSHAYRGFDTRMFEAKGHAVFNFGTSSQTPIQSGYILDKYLNQLGPECVIYEVYPLTFSLDGLESTLDILPKVDLDKGMMNMVSSVNHIKAWNSLSFKAFNEFIIGESVNEWDLRDLVGTDRYIPGGYVIRESSESAISEWFIPQTINPLPKQVKLFEQQIKDLVNLGVRVILIQTPVLPEYYESIQNRKEFDDYFNSLAGTEYYNFNDLIHLDPEQHFYDFHHLNQSGVEAFNKFLLEEIEGF